MKNRFIEKMMECGLSSEQAKQVEKICLDEIEEAKVAGGSNGICYCPNCGRWVSERYWDDHLERCPGNVAQG